MNKRKIDPMAQVIFGVVFVATLYLVFSLGRFVGWSEHEGYIASQPTPEPEVLTVIVEVTPEPTPEPGPQRNERYASIEMTEQEVDELAALIKLEAGGEPAEGQQAVAEVVFNRVLSDGFSTTTVHDTIYDTSYGVQFSPYEQVATTTGDEAQYQAIENALYGDSVLPQEVVYFSTKPHNDRVWGQIGGHWFCYE